MKFIADAMLGRLAKWLRMLGYDTLYDPHWDDNELVRRARAEERLILTRDTALAKRPGVRTLLISSQSLEGQLRQILDELGLEAHIPLSRCSLCNVPLEKIERAAAQNLVPPYVFATQRHFMRCPQCARVYWRGTHWQRMKELLDRIAARS